MVKEEHDEEYSEPEQMRKLFIGGLDYRTSDEGLKSYFEQFGEIVDVVVMKDPKTQRSRGFGFVAFSRAYMVDEAQRARPHKIDDRTVDTKRAVPRDEISKPEAGATVKKLFVGGMREDIDEDDLREAFQEFGEIVAVTIPTEKDSEKQRGFAFVEFEDYDAVDKACVKKEIKVRNKRVDVKKALSKSEMSRRQGSGGGGGRNSWGGGGRNNWSGNQGSGWNDGPSPWNNQNNYNGPRGGGFNQGPWQSGPPNQGWSNNQGGGWGNNQGGGGWGNNQGSPWNQDCDNFGDNYGQSFGGGPMRSGQNFSQGGRSGPYSSGGGYASSGGSNRRY